MMEDLSNHIERGLRYRDCRTCSRFYSLQHPRRFIEGEGNPERDEDESRGNVSGCCFQTGELWSRITGCEG